MFLSLRHLAAKILAAAVKELFPEALLIEGKGTSFGFYYDFVFPFKFKKEFLIPLEEKMRFIIKEKRAIKILEMIPSNAAEFLMHHGQRIPAEIVKEKKQPLVQIFQMDSFIDFLETDTLGKIEQLNAFKLQEVIVEEEITRLIGTAFSDKQQLKEFLKKNKMAPALNHRELGEKLRLFTWREGELLWCPKGERLREMLLNLLKNEYEKDHFERVATYAEGKEMLECHEHLHSLYGFAKTAELFFLYPPSEQEFSSSAEMYELSNKGRKNLFENIPCVTDRGYIFYREKELVQEMISSLQFILKIPKILGFEYEVVLVTPQKAKSQKTREKELLICALQECQIAVHEEERRGIDRPLVEVRGIDALGRKWVTSFLELDLKKKVIVQAASTSIERLIALVLEHYRGELPFWLAPEQVRIIALANQRAEARRLQELIASSGFRVTLDDSSEQLSHRMHKVLLEQVPYSICIGEREQKRGQVAIRAYRSKKEESMRIEELIPFLKREAIVEV